MSIGSIIVLIAVIAAAALALRSIIKDAKSGKENCSTCMTGCSYDAQGNKVCTPALKMVEDVDRAVRESRI